jgi:hypothetical protein
MVEKVANTPYSPLNSIIRENMIPKLTCDNFTNTMLNSLLSFLAYLTSGINFYSFRH